MLEKFDKIKLVQIAKFLQIDLKETEKEIVHNTFSVLTDLINYTFNFLKAIVTQNIQN